MKKSEINKAIKSVIIIKKRAILLKIALNFQKNYVNLSNFHVND